MNLSSWGSGGFFSWAVGASLIGHALLFVPGWHSGEPTDFSVERGISSVEVVFLEESVRKADFLKPRKPKMKKEIQKPKTKTEKVVSQKKNEAAVPVKETSAAKEVSQPLDALAGKKIVAIASTGAVMEARPVNTHNAAPKYPAEARAKGWQGTCWLKVHVSRQGRPQSVLIEKTSGHRVLDDAALRAVKQWKFIPSHAGAVAFDSWVRVPVKFILEKN